MTQSAEIDAHVHAWEHQQNVTSKGYAMPPYEACACGAARRPTAEIDALRAEVEILRDSLAETTRWLAEAQENPRDEYHTMDELYEYRMLYNALWVNELARHGDVPVCKSWFHSDGEECFGGGWFIVVAELPTGQVSNHYKAEHWDIFRVPAVNRPPEYDGHTPEVAADRMGEFLGRRGTTVTPPGVSDA